MAEVPYIQLFQDDLLAGMLELSAEERGAYVTMLAMMWSKGRGLRDDNQWLARMCNVSTRKFGIIKNSLIELGKIAVVDGLIVNYRALETHENARKSREIAIENGSKGGKKRAENMAKTAGNSQSAPSNPSDPASSSQNQSQNQLSQVSSVSSTQPHTDTPKPTSASSGRAHVNFMTFGCELQEIAALPSNISFVPVRQWLEAGIDPDLIRRVVENKASSQLAAGQPIRSFNYFKEAILEAHAMATGKPQLRVVGSQLAEKPDDWKDEDENSEF